MKIGSVLENQNLEKRIAITPELVKKYTSLGFEVNLIENYGSGSRGSLIRNATSGSTYEHTVGSQSENLYFKVIDSTGRFFRKTPLILYYDSPEQYENHHHVTVKTEIKNMWHERSLKTRKCLGL